MLGFTKKASKLYFPSLKSPPPAKEPGVSNRDIDALSDREILYV